MAETPVTARRLAVLGALLDASGEMYVLQVAKTCELPTAVAARALRTLECEGILTSRLERAGVRRGKPRQYYKFTAEGAERARTMQAQDGRTTG